MSGLDVQAANPLVVQAANPPVVPAINPPAYPAPLEAYAGLQHPMGNVVGAGPVPINVPVVPSEEVQHHDEESKESDKKKKKKLEELGEVDPANLIPGKGPGGAPQQYFNVSS